MNKTLLTAALLAIAMPHSGVLADALVCPLTIKVQESLAQVPSKEWLERADTAPRNLAGVTFFDGNPVENRSLVPDKDFRVGKDRVAVWSFGGSSVPIWLACRYLDTGITLSKQLPVTYKECRLTYGPRAMVKTIECK